MAVQGAVRLDKVAASNSGGKLIQFQAPADFQNGFVFHAEDLVSGERELFATIEPATATITAKSVYLHASVETTYLAGQTITDFYVASGSNGRGVRLEPGDIVTITTNVITGTVAKDSYLVPQNASYQLAVAADLTGGTKFAAKIIDITETIFGQAAAVVQVVSN